MFALGLLYTRGEGPSPDPAKGIQLIKEASTCGSQSAQEYLGDKYEKGDATSQSDLERARSYFVSAQLAGIRCVSSGSADS